MDGEGKVVVWVVSLLATFILLLAIIARVGNYYEKSQEIESNRPNCVCGCVVEWEKDNK